MGRAEAAMLRVEVAFSPRAREVRVVSLLLPAGSTLADALGASALVERDEWESLGVGIWGRRGATTTPLRDGDRVECWRGLQVDPKQARRQRHAAQKKGKPARGAKSRSPPAR